MSRGRQLRRNCSARSATCGGRALAGLPSEDQQALAAAGPALRRLAERMEARA